jgi:hypothetical protein
MAIHHLELAKRDNDLINTFSDFSELGSCVLQYCDDNLNLLLVGWRGARVLRAYVDQADTVHMLRHVYFIKKMCTLLKIILKN